MYMLEGFGVIVVESRVRTGAAMAVVPDAGDNLTGSMLEVSAGGTVWLTC